MKSVLGLVSLYPSDTLPKDWLPCDGRTLDVVNHPELSALLDPLATSHTTFQLPKMSPLNGINYMIYAPPHEMPRCPTTYVGRIELFYTDTMALNYIWYRTTGGQIGVSPSYAGMATRNISIPVDIPNIPDCQNVPYYLNLGGSELSSYSTDEEADFVGKISLFCFNMIMPPGWFECNGMPYPTAGYPELTTLLGSKYNGRTPKLDAPIPGCSYWIYGGQPL